MPLEGERKPRVFLQTQFSESSAMISPDGHWVAYISDESGRLEVYVRPFPGPGGKWQVSTEGGGRLMRGIHDRMPVILDKATLNDWLSPEIHEQRELKELMKPCPDEWLSAEEISPLVNSLKNNSPEILKPAAVAVGTKGLKRVLFED